MLDGLVRNTRGGAPPTGLGARLLALWRARDDGMLALLPQGLQFDDDATHPLESGWAYYAFMAGLRSVRLTETTDLADVLRLASALADVRFSVDAAERLRAWTWEEDGEAFRLTVTRSFAETMEASEVAPELAITAVTALRSYTLGDLWIAVEPPRPAEEAFQRESTLNDVLRGRLGPTARCKVATAPADFRLSPSALVGVGRLPPLLAALVQAV